MKEVTGGDSTHKIAGKMKDGTSPATVNRWQKSRPDADKVVSFCRAYGENPIKGLVQAGYITEEEARTGDLATRSTEDLLAEVERRTKGR
ncbi:MAG: hypothetical protein JWN52_6615 [Actinomycetia bacterium]|nr:hypothetical protein [Actinomycetes bacterium]